MSDAGTPKVKGWSDTEKLGLILQIVAKQGKIPWDQLELPSGRTMKACQVMLDKEKSKVKKTRATESNGAEESSTPTGTKRTKTDSNAKPAKKAHISSNKAVIKVKGEPTDESDGGDGYGFEF